MISSVLFRYLFRLTPEDREKLALKLIEEDRNTESEDRERARLDLVYNDGKSARISKIPHSCNPFPRGSKDWETWSDGWLRGRDRPSTPAW